MNSLLYDYIHLFTDMWKIHILVITDCVCFICTSLVITLDTCTLSLCWYITVDTCTLSLCWCHCRFLYTSCHCVGVTVDSCTLSLCWCHCRYLYTVTVLVSLQIVVHCHCIGVIVDSCTLSLCWCRIVPHRDCSHHPHTHHGDTLSLVVMRV